MSLSSTTPLPTTSSQTNTERGGGQYDLQPPDRFSDHAANSAERFLVIQWMDDRKGAWSKEWWLSLGTSGSTTMIRRRYGLGVYRSRQWRIIFDAPCLFELSTIEEDIRRLE